MWKKVLIGLGLGTGAFAAYSYIMKLLRAAQQMQSVASVMIHSIDLTKGMTIRVDVRLKNPNDVAFKIKFPFVKILYKGAVIGTSQVINIDKPLPAFGEAVFEMIMINIPLLGLASTVIGVASSLLKGEAIQVSCTTISTIDIGWKQIPYEKTEDVILKHKK